MSQKKIYIAGPAVFHADHGKAYYDHVRELTAANNIKPLIPLDNNVSGALNIRNANIEQIKQCDAIIADLSPFRSHEPDCGTAFEVGYAAALNKIILTFSSDQRTLVERYGGVKDSLGMEVEDFNLPFNLMLADGTAIFGSFDEALSYFVDKHL
ncbi:nucleoside 2-deoxyribosyltransferase [Angomonas deanei]|uniref:Nucleoside 2-deoxyribosyltransferase, putative n=1 Tax=Angomonas deanei TaxID=59799 RepID=S9WXE1_9TRYP|nr:nucleoside 2-deoxyribosyltransferase [Angomonas deanei]EPY39223.1 nucleoside 2-deoxyribosyltransferase [Angomonas deanei]EPY40695.1 nucleoside 2-deoxyribosyltransferase [Angomonas deanei]CAD2220830.1 Nucleoside 2-deoxyribosyltransferase, putative [Angomonas deanei]|eukprot:EPY38918.1 nucleoside 2-deoxyribosyltransferase [Angomonas deanei]